MHKKNLVQIACAVPKILSRIDKETQTHRQTNRHAHYRGQNNNVGYVSYIYLFADNFLLLTCTSSQTLFIVHITNKLKYTPWVKKTRHQTLGHNFSKYYPIFKMFSLADSAVNLQQIRVYIFHHALNVSLHYLVKYECRKMASFWNTYCN